MSGTDEKVPSFEEFKAPWEVDSDGNEIPEDEQEVDRSVLKKLLWNLRRDKAKALTQKQQVEAERDQLKEKVAEKEREGESEVDRLKREKAELEQKLAKSPADDVEKTRLKAALEAGLPAKHVGRLNQSLTDFDELVEDAKELMASFGGGASTNTDDDDDTDTPRGRPTRQRTNGDPKGGRRTNEVSIDDLLEAVPSSSTTFRT